MTSLRIRGQSEKLGSVQTSEEFLTWEVPDNDSTNRMRRLLSEMGRSVLVLDATKYSGLTFGDKAHATFIDSEDFRGGREDSAHQVKFGQLILNGKDFREQPEFVAIKSYDDRADLYKEWAAHEYMNSLFNRQIGYLNLGVYNDQEGTESIVSEYDHGVVSFDSSYWADPDEPSSALRPETLRRHALLGVQGLGMFHGARMTHGDAQVKNLAADRLGPRAIDLETANILDEENIDDPASFEQTRKDISSFIESMGRVEENRQSIRAALRPERVADRLVRAYSEGVKEGRAALNGEYVPDFGRMNTEVIRDELATLIR